ncbi:MAG: MFS transporter [Nodularia sp. (in: Bacteria)]|nr:MAG: MFS transporter [Nodularia sp. (in: cyanobacteria)]
MPAIKQGNILSSYRIFLLVIHTKSLKKLGLLGSLYVSQSIPVMFLFQALPVFMRQQGASLETIGLLSLLALPWMLKFLWSPLIDRYSFTRLGHYRFWIICFQLLFASATAICAFLDLQNNFLLGFVCILLIGFFCASQDIATDALAVGLLEADERGLGNGVQLAGNNLGAVLGGGGMLLLLNHWGWRASMLSLAAIVVLALIPLLWHRERQQEVKESLSSSSQGYLQTFIHFYRRPGMKRWLLVLVLYLAGGSMASQMFRPLLVDIGLSLTDIGLLLGVVAYGAGTIGAIVAGFFIVPWGRKRSLIIFGLLQAFSLVAYLLPASGVTHLPVLYLVAISVNLTFSMATTATFTIMMDQSKLETPGTDYTVQTSVVYFGGIVAAAMGGGIAANVGYQGLFSISIIITLLSLIILHKVFDAGQLAPQSIAEERNS